LGQTAPAAARLVDHDEQGNNAGRPLGVIDERAELERISENIVGPELRVHLSRVVQINSVGHLRWVNWLKQLMAKSLRISFHECPPVLVRQANIDAALFQGLPVISFQLPLYCGRCDVEQLVLVESETVRQHGLPSLSCHRCDGAMILDDIEAHYLLFLDETRPTAERRRYPCLRAAIPVRCHCPMTKCVHCTSPTSPLTVDLFGRCDHRWSG